MNYIRERGQALKLKIHKTTSSLARTYWRYYTKKQKIKYSAFEKYNCTVYKAQLLLFSWSLSTHSWSILQFVALYNVFAGYDAHTVQNLEFRCRLCIFGWSEKIWKICITKRANDKNNVCFTSFLKIRKWNEIREKKSRGNTL
jgi:uncharacterized membrane protein YbhN (UPF0104 family)